MCWLRNKYFFCEISLQQCEISPLQVVRMTTQRVHNIYLQNIKFMLKDSVIFHRSLNQSRVFILKYNNILSEVLRTKMKTKLSLNINKYWVNLYTYFFKVVKFDLHGEWFLLKVRFLKKEELSFVLEKSSFFSCMVTLKWYLPSMYFLIF